MSLHKEYTGTPTSYRNGKALQLRNQEHGEVLCSRDRNYPVIGITPDDLIGWITCVTKDPDIAGIEMRNRLVIDVSARIFIFSVAQELTRADDMTTVFRKQRGSVRL